MGKLAFPLSHVDVRDLVGRKMEHGKLLGKIQKNPYTGETTAAWRNYFGIQLPPASLDISGLPRCAWAGDGICGIITIKSKIPKWEKLGRNGAIIASRSFRGHPRTSAMCVEGRWGMENYLGKHKIS